LEYILIGDITIHFCFSLDKLLQKQETEEDMDFDLGSRNKKLRREQEKRKEVARLNLQREKAMQEEVARKQAESDRTRQQRKEEKLRKEQLVQYI